MHPAGRIQSIALRCRLLLRRRSRWRTCRRCRRGLRLRFRLVPNAFSVRLGRRPRGLQLGNHRIGVDIGRSRGREIAGNMHHRNRNGGRFVFVQGVGDGETTVRGRQGDGAWRLAARSQRRLGVGALRRRIQLNLNRRRLRLEHVHGKGGAAGQADAGCGNYDNSTHDRPVTLCGECHNPRGGP